MPNSARTERRKAAGLCGSCGRPNDNDGVTCSYCLEKNRLFRQRRRDTGKCQRCGADAIPGRSLCETHALDSVTRTARNSHPDSAFSVEDAKAALGRQGGRCAYTDIPLQIGRGASVDHVQPKSRGGDGSLNNLEWTTTLVNKMKLNQTPEEFLMTCAQVLAAAPPKRMSKVSGLEMVEYFQQTQFLPNGCQQWTGEYEVESGEPIFHYRGGRIYAKDLSCLITSGKPPQRHTCGNKFCVKHLEDDAGNPS